MRRYTAADDARLTLVDMVHIAASVAVFAFLGVVFYDLLGQQQLSTGVSLLMQALIPAMVVTIMMVIFTVAVQGRAS